VAGLTDKYTFSIRGSEVFSANSGQLLLRVAVSAEGSSLQPDVPQIAGLEPISVNFINDRVVALFPVEAHGLYLLSIAGINESTSGDYELQISIAGDINVDGLIDGIDNQILNDAQGTSEGQAGYLFEADLDGSGVIDITDTQVLIKNYGFIANQAPVISAEIPETLTHKDLQVTIDLSDIAFDPDGDRIFYRIASTTNGITKFSTDGQLAIFTPDSGYIGLANFEIVADDGFNSSTIAVIEINVSNAPLENLSINLAGVIMYEGDSTELVITGDFADQDDVILPLSYVTTQLTDDSIVNMDSYGSIQAIIPGITILSVSKVNLQAVAVIGVYSVPEDDEYYDYIGSDYIDVYPGALTLAGPDTQRQFLVGRYGTYELGPASAGSLYFVGNTEVLSVSEDGLVTALTEGQATLYVINGTAQENIPVRVELPSTGPTVLGSDGGAIKASDGTIVTIAPGALDDESTITIDPVIEADLSLEVPEPFGFVGAFDLDLGDGSLTETAQITIPVSPDIPVGEIVYFFRETALLDESGQELNFWILIDTGVVSADAIAKTTSPPYPGFSEGGQYLCAQRDFPDEMIDIEFKLTEEGSVIGTETYTTFTTNDTAKMGVIVGRGAIPVESGPISEFTIRSYDYTKALPFYQQIVRVDTEGFEKVITKISIPTPAPYDSPIINEISVQVFNPNDPSDPSWIPQVTLYGENLDGTNVAYSIGEHIDSIENPIVSTDQEITFEVSGDIILGLANFSAKNDKTGLKSNTVKVKPPGGFGFTILAFEKIGVFGSDLIPDPNNPDINELVAELDFDGRPNLVVVTSDRTRAYVSLKPEYDQNSGTQYPGGITVLDTVTIRQVDFDTDTPEMDLIHLDDDGNHVPGIEQIRSLAIDPSDRFLYALDNSGAVYIIDIDPLSENYHKIIETIDPNPSSSGGDFRNVVVSSDGRRLYVAF
ncbi:Ig-like domain-containing protein, partial [Planctomycetota bacterium]